MCSKIHLPDGSCRLQDPNRTILGAPQREYLKSQLSAAEGKHTWKVLGQQVGHLNLGSKKGFLPRCASDCTLAGVRRRTKGAPFCNMHAV